MMQGKLHVRFTNIQVKISGKFYLNVFPKIRLYVKNHIQLGILQLTQREGYYTYAKTYDSALTEQRYLNKGIVAQPPNLFPRTVKPRCNNSQ